MVEKRFVLGLLFMLHFVRGFHFMSFLLEFLFQLGFQF
jgi:hypothetical protein